MMKKRGTKPAGMIDIPEIIDIVERSFWTRTVFILRANARAGRMPTSLNLLITKRVYV